MARRLGRAFLPLAALFLVGTLLLVLRGGTAAAVVMVGAPVAAGAALAHGLRTARQAGGGATRSWTALVSAGGAPCWIYALIVLGLGLRWLVPEPWSWSGFGVGFLHTLLALWLLKAWWQLSEVRGMVDVLGHLPGEGTSGP